MVKIERQIVPNHIVKSRSYGPGNTMTEIAIHETANTQIGANAQAHSNLQINGNRREASWHYQVDDKRIIQSFEDNIRAWHAGNGNGRSIGIEICVNRDGNFTKAVDNAAKLTQILMARHNIPLSGVKQHNHYTGKNCPTNLRNGSKGINWNDFINKVSGANSSKPVNSSKPSSPKKTVAELAQEVLAGKWGNGDERKRRLEAAGYNYSAVQNAVNQGKQSKPSKPKLKSVTTVAQEVIAGKWGNGSQRKQRLQAAGYNYNAVQNEVNKLAGATKPNKKSNEAIAKEVIAGKWGNGAERKRRLEAAGYNFNTIQKIVNRLV